MKLLKENKFYYLSTINVNNNLQKLSPGLVFQNTKKIFSEEILKFLDCIVIEESGTIWLIAPWSFCQHISDCVSLHETRVCPIHGKKAKVKARHKS